MLNKPKGVVSATRDACRTVTDLLKDTGYDDLFPVGRLDKDTEGLLLMTNDGNLAHNLLSPKKHVEKKYYVELERTLGEEDRKALETGVDIGEERLTFPAKVEQITETSIFLIITEGKYHQVKRMMLPTGNKSSYPVSFKRSITVRHIASLVAETTPFGLFCEDILTISSM